MQCERGPKPPEKLEKHGFRKRAGKSKKQGLTRLFGAPIYPAHAARKATNLAVGVASLAK
jgi:hypothetical protein